MTPYCYVSPAPAQKKKKKKSVEETVSKLDFGVNFGWDRRFVEQAPFDPAVNKDIIQSLASRPTLSCCYRDVFFGKTRASSDKGEIWKSIPSKRELFHYIFCSQQPYTRVIQFPVCALA